MRKNKSILRKTIRISAAVIIVFGLALMVLKIATESEPGAIPLALIVVGTLIYGFVHFRMPPA